jgi:hypothetical protein
MTAIFFSVGFAILFAAFAYYRYIIHLARKHYKKTMEKQNKADSQITYVDYRGHQIPMTVKEKRVIWDNLTREGKNNALSDWKKHLKSNK